MVKDTLSLGLTSNPRILPLTSGHMLRPHVNLCLLCGAPIRPPLFIPTVSKPRPAFSKLLFNFHAAGIIFLRYHEDRMTPLLKELEWHLYLSLSFLFGVYGAPRTLSGAQKALSGHRLNGSETSTRRCPTCSDLALPVQSSSLETLHSLCFPHLAPPEYPCPAHLHAFACAGPSADILPRHSPEGLQFAG